MEECGLPAGGHAHFFCWAAQVTKTPMHIFPTSMLIIFSNSSKTNPICLTASLLPCSQAGLSPSRCCLCSTPFTLTSPAGQDLPRITLLKHTESTRCPHGHARISTQTLPWILTSISCKFPWRDGTLAGWRIFLRLLCERIAGFDLTFSLCTTRNF